MNNICLFVEMLGMSSLFKHLTGITACVRKPNGKTVRTGTVKRIETDKNGRRTIFTNGTVFREKPQISNRKGS